RKLSLAIWTLVLSSVISGILLVVRANGFVQLFNAAIWAISMFGLFAHLVRTHTHWSFLSLLQTILQIIPAGFLQGLLMISSIFRARDSKRSALYGWIKTAGIAIAVFLFFVGILSQSDPVFNEMVKGFREQLFGRTLQSALLLIVAGATLSVVLPKQSDEPWRLRLFSYRDSLAILLTTLLVIGLFLFVQFRYLFGGSRELLVALDLTFSEYVRKGFIELLIATFAGGVLVYLMTLKQRVLERGQAMVTKLASSALVVELFLLLGSALKRDMLYVETYGLTRVRVVGGLFLIWLAGLLLSLLFFVVWKRMKELNLLRAVWGLSLFVWLALNILNVDRIVAQGGPEHHEYTDYYYIANLSEDAASEWSAMIQNIAADTDRLLANDELDDKEKAELAGLKLSLVALMERREKLYMHHASADWVLENYSSLRVDDLYYSWDGTNRTKLPKQLQIARGWRFYNAAEANAVQIVRENESLFFETVDATFRRIQLYQIEHGVDLRKHEDRLLYEFTYPFIDIRLRYNSQELTDSTHTYGVSQLNDEEKNLLYALELSQPNTIAKLRELQCGEIATVENPVVVYGQFRDMTQIQEPAGVVSLVSLSDASMKLSVAVEHVTQTNRPMRVSLVPSLVSSSDRCEVRFRVESAEQFAFLTNGRY
ncbi:MAG: DUF4173 domain-containing protein, partial [Candidatus Pacebacteria bacterium]|nr:DUF4173 domain-containing protein [Candidatus Paceibacterota bacterium]